MFYSIANKYFIKKYGFVYAPKPPLGPYTGLKKRIQYLIWKFDCLIDEKYRYDFKIKWKESFDYYTNNPTASHQDIHRQRSCQRAQAVIQ